MVSSYDKEENVSQGKTPAATRHDPVGESVMSQTQVDVQGTLQPDGTLLLDEKPNLPPGRVRVVVQTVPEPASEGWWPYLQRVRAEREAAGYPFLSEQERNS